MKRLLYLLPLLLATSCATTSGIQMLNKAGDADVTTVTGCDTCVEVRVKNMGPDNISSVEVQNNKGETYFFAGVKAGKSSPYQQFHSLCNCGYEIKVTYYKSEDNKRVLPAMCQNILPCTDFLKGKVTIEINTPKLPDTLSGKSNGRLHTVVNFKKD